MPDETINANIQAITDLITESLQGYVFNSSNTTIGWRPNVAVTSGPDNTMNATVVLHPPVQHINTVISLPVQPSTDFRYVCAVCGEPLFPHRHYYHEEGIPETVHISPCPKCYRTPLEQLPTVNVEEQLRRIT